MVSVVTSCTYAGMFLRLLSGDAHFFLYTNNSQLYISLTSYSFWHSCSLLILPYFHIKLLVDRTDYKKNQ